jgi:polyisoprenoid-binding protein YceI
VSVETPHIPQGSYWRGKFDHTQSGLISLDRHAHKGSIEVVIETNSLDFGLDKLNEMVRGPQFFDSVKYPTATFRADSISFQGDTPVEAIGVLSLHGIAQPLSLKINSFKCIPDQYLKAERCAADASGVIDRTAFEISNYAQMTGSEVKLAIQVEGLLQK